MERSREVDSDRVYGIYQRTSGHRVRNLWKSIDFHWIFTKNPYITQYSLDPLTSFSCDLLYFDDIFDVWTWKTHFLWSDCNNFDTIGKFRPCTFQNFRIFWKRLRNHREILFWNFRSWKKNRFLKNQWKPMEIQYKSMKNQWKSIKSYENQCISRKIKNFPTWKISNQDSSAAPKSFFKNSESSGK